MTAALFLLDTNVLSEPMRSKPNPNIMTRLKAHQQRLATSTLVWHELLFGCYRLPESRKRAAIEAYLFEVVQPNVTFFSYEKRAAQWHAKERARLEKIGRTPSFTDGQIAATAHAHACVLVTVNTSDFEFFEELNVVNWALP